MSDRFKFRVWDKENKEYTTDSRIFLSPNGTVRYIEDSYWYDNVSEYYDVEFCTGLKDKNGKLIYDGDYIRAVNQDTKDRPDLQVGHIWVDEMGCRWIKFKTEELSWNDFCSLIDYDATLEIEVIGNEHERAEKLAQENAKLKELLKECRNWLKSYSDTHSSIKDDVNETICKISEVLK
jgi:hypothetical protein